MSKGFTLIEALVSITVLMLSITAPLTLSYTGLTAAYLAEDQIVAYYLAQDAMEFVRNIRETNKLAGRDVLYGLDICSVGSGDDRGCYIDTLNKDFFECATLNCPEGVLKFHPTTGVYDHSNTPAPVVNSRFTREIKVKYLGAENNEAVIDVIVRWKQSTGKEQVYKLRTNLTKW